MPAAESPPGRMTGAGRRLWWWRCWRRSQQRSVLACLCSFLLGLVGCRTLLLATRSTLSPRPPFLCPPGQPWLQQWGSVFRASRTRPLQQSRELLLVGVMTSRKFLETRARAIHRTWSQEVKGKVLYFVGEGDPPDSDLDVVTLAGVKDDGYPPQRKSFAMLSYMFENYGERFHWFARLDDDVYIRPAKLTSLLASLNASHAFYIGQPGFGRGSERGKLGLPLHMPYCMGGTGVFLSRGALSTLTPHLSGCLNTTVTSHEDSELGRCVYEALGVSCTSALQFTEIFFSIYEGEVDPRKKAFTRAYTIHPIKNPQEMVALHMDQLGHEVERMKRKARRLEAEISEMKSFTAHTGNSATIGGETSSGKSGSHLRPDPALNDVESWDFVTRNQVHSLHNTYSVPVDAVSMKGFDKLSLVRTVSAVQHLIPSSPPPAFLYRGRSVSGGLYHRLFFPNASSNTTTAFATVQRLGKARMVEDDHLRANKIFVIIPVHQRSERLRYFLKTVRTSLASDLPAASLSVHLKFMVFVDSDGDHEKSYRMCREETSREESPFETECLLVSGSFSRGRAFHLGMQELSGGALVLLCDVDVLFTRAFLHRAAANVVQGRQLYFPICFSQFDPELLCRGLGRCGEQPPFLIWQDGGLWRSFGFGLAALYKSDFQAVGGFDLRIRGWGGEDVDLFERCLRSGLAVVRAPDPQLVHVYHPKLCGGGLSPEQARHCRSSRLELVGSRRTLASLLLQARPATTD